MFGKKNRTDVMQKKVRGTKKTSSTSKNIVILGAFN
jgi:hypothetical protein